ncbi:MAG: hypothetical protein CME06_01485 [Gemmatimonadetes bacterium]|nr:hypothetical protein [Gemmatimonadota bacterium]
MTRVRASLAALFATLATAATTDGAEEMALGEVLQPVYLASIWHQHQASYIDPVTDGLRAPWVRTHAT